METHRLELCWTEKEQILAEWHADIKQHEFQADYDRISVRKLGDILLNLSKKNFIALRLKNFNDEINNFFMHSYCSKNWEFREAHRKSLNEMEELRKFQSSIFDTIARRRFVEDQDTILELTGKIQEPQNEINCMNDSKDFQDAESIRSGNSHVTSRPVDQCLSHLIQFVEECSAVL